jgi:glycosyltransferase involved in cell wall biosynthesis
MSTMTTFAPLISVIIPTHNRPELVFRSVRSVLRQSYVNLEVIVVDVGLKHRAISSLKPLMTDVRLRYVAHPVEVRGGVARNIGATHAHGEYLAFQDDDDEWLPEKLTLQMHALQQASAQAGLVYGAVRMDYGNGRMFETHVHEGEHNIAELALRRLNGFLTVTLLIPTKVFCEVGGFDEHLPSHQDPELVIRIAQKYTAVGVNTPLVHVYVGQGSSHVGGNVSLRILGRSMLLEKHAQLFASRKKILAQHYFWMGIWARDSKAYGLATSLFTSSVRTHLRFWVVIHLCSSWLSMLLHSQKLSSIVSIKTSYE